MEWSNKIKLVFFLLSFIICLMLAQYAEGLNRIDSSTVKSVSILIPKDGGAIMKNIASVLSSRIKERSEVKVKVGGEGELKIVLNLKPGIGLEGFKISDAGHNIIQITGNDARGVLYGVGKFLRASTYNRNGFTPGKWRGTSIPQKSIRGIYLATHFFNYYQNAPVEEVKRYIEDLALWGYNTFMFWYDMHHFNGFDDPEAISFRARMKQLAQAVRKIDLGVGFMVVGNEGYANSPIELRAVPGGSRGGDYPQEICPNKVGGLDYILQTKGDFFNWCQDINPEYICIWPYDQGGCGSVNCQPWGSNGFIKCASNISRMAKEKLPGVKIIFSTWHFDSVEWKGLVDHISLEAKWIDIIMAEKINSKYKGIFSSVPDDIPIVGFPEISMYNTFPWGGFGATPLPNHLLKQWNKVEDKLSGGFPYSEGIFDDINKVIFAGLYWDSKTPVEKTLKEYIAYEYSHKAIDSILKVIKILEQNHHYRWWPGELEDVKLTMDWFPSKGSKSQADPGAEEAFYLVKQADAKMPKWARKSWRWRILYIRAMLDAELKANGGSPNEACIEGFKELIKLYHVSEKTDPVVKPPIALFK